MQTQAQALLTSRELDQMRARLCFLYSGIAQPRTVGEYKEWIKVYEKEVVSRMLKAKENGITVLALLGKSGGPCAALADLALIVPSSTTARIQEMHIMIGHRLCEMVERDLGLD